MTTWKRILSTEHMLLLLWIVGFAVYQMHPWNDPDTPWHLATGRYILQHHAVPTTDPFSWSAHGQTWITQEWLFEVVFAFFAMHLGFFGGWLLQVVDHTITVLVVYRVACKISRGNRVVAAAAACLATVVPLIFWTMRPQIFSYMMFAVFLWILERVRSGRFRVLWMVPPLMLVWANTHGSSTIGLFMLVLEVIISFVPSVGRAQRLILPRGARIRLLAAAVVGAAVGLINPNGIKAYTYALLSTNTLMTDNIMEWHSPNFHSDTFKYDVLLFLIGVFLLLILRTRTVPMRELLYFGGSFAMTLIYQRFTPYLAIAAAPLVAFVLADWGRGLLRPTRYMVVLNGLIMVCSLGYFGSQLPKLPGSIDQHMDSGAYPVAAVDYMKAHGLTDHVLNAYHWGGYLIWRGVPTFVDGRTDIFLQNNIFSDYLAMKNVWWNCPSLLDQYKFKAVLFPTGYPILTYLEHDPHWKVAYRQGNAEILVPVGKS